MRRPITFLLVTVLMLTLVSAFDFLDRSDKKIYDFDNVKNAFYNGEKYPELRIKNTFGFGKDIWIGELKSNTDVCAVNCEAIKNITISEPTELISDVRFMTLQKDGTWVEEPIKSYNFYIKTSQSSYNVDDFQTQCVVVGQTLNGTDINECSNVKVGSHTEYIKEWEPYIVGDIVAPGNYEIKLEGEKQPRKTVDWQIKTNGEWLDEWATWTAALNVDLVTYYTFNETTGNLIDFIGSTDLPEFGTVGTAPGIISNSRGTYTNSNYLNGSLNATFTSGSNNMSTSGIFSVSVWFNATNNAANQTIYAFDDVDDNSELFFHFKITPTDKLFGLASFRGSASDTFFSANNISMNTWNNLIVVHNESGGSFFLYLNGSLIGQLDGVNAGSNPSTRLTIGRGFDFNDPMLNGFIDEMALWGRALTVGEITEIYNNGLGISPSQAEIAVTLNTPLDNVIVSSISPTTFNGTGTSVISNITNMSLYTNESGIFEAKNTTIGLSGLTSTQTWNRTLAVGTYVWNVEVCDLNGFCAFATSNRTIESSVVVEDSITFNTTTFETASETFTLNLTSNSSLTNAYLIYGTKNFETTLTANQSIVTIDVPNTPGNQTFNYTFTFAGANQTGINYFQNISSTLFGLCNATLTTSYVNISFRNETTAEENITAEISSSWDVWLGGGSVKKSVNVINSSENLNYNLCFIPVDRTVKTEVNLTYNNNISQQRSFTSTPLLTNVTTQIILYLLPSNLGLFTTFNVKDIANNPLALVRGIITRTLGGNTITVASGFTDSSGLIIFFLNPDITYNAVFSKFGFLDNTFTFVPTTDARLVTMGSGTTVEGSNISIGLDYQITPQNSSLANDTNFTFGFNVTGNTLVTFISMNITNQDNEQLAFQSNAGTGFISQIVNTSNNTRIIGRYVITTQDETLTITKLWVVGNEFVGDYSIFRQGTLYLDYKFSDFIRLILVVLVLFGMLIFMSRNELADNNESKVAVILLLIWAFSLIGWLNNPMVEPGLGGIQQYGRQYGIAILSSVAGIFFFMRRLFI